MKEHAKLWNGDMVRAYMAGRKTQTRVPIKGVPYYDHAGTPLIDWTLSGIYQATMSERCGYYSCEKGKFYMDVQTEVDDNSHEEIKCPFGVPGDRLWIRETWCPGTEAMARKEADNICFRAEPCPCGGLHGAVKWRPSIHMPRWACRLTPLVLNVRCERVQDISIDDCIAEGVGGNFALGSFDPQEECPSPDEMFVDLWDGIYAAKGCGWDTNCWVWVAELEAYKP